MALTVTLMPEFMKDYGSLSTFASAHLPQYHTTMVDGIFMRLGEKMWDVQT